MRDSTRKKPNRVRSRIRAVRNTVYVRDARGERRPGLRPPPV
jgi:hypothetical protein